MPRRRKRLEWGIEQTPTGFRTYVRVAGVLHSKRWKPTATLQDLRRWREEQRGATE